MSKLLRQRYPFLEPSLAIDHLVVGAGVVGLAIGEKLVQAFPSRTTFVVERHERPGEEITARNSEVLHAGIYYPTNSLKFSLCIRGRTLAYARCTAHNIPFRKTQKLILATSPAQASYIQQKDHDIRLSNRGSVPLRWLSGAEARDLEPDLSERVIGAMLSEETGIVSAHALVQDLERAVEESEMGEMVYGTKVVRIDRAVTSKGGKRGDGSEDGWVVQTVSGMGDGKEGERSAVLAKVVVNAAGLNAHHVQNQILPPESLTQLYFAKGSYFGYRGPGIKNVRRLLYPCPEPGSALEGLGTHLTMNLADEIRFGPDVEWIKAPLLEEGGEEEADFWLRHLSVNEDRLSAAVQEVQKYLPGVDPAGFYPDYVGIRPKLTQRGESAADFSISHLAPGFISLTGIESPGLTSSLAIGEYVERMVREQVWGVSAGKGGRESERVSEAGSVEAWA